MIFYELCTSLLFIQISLAHQRNTQTSAITINSVTFDILPTLSHIKAIIFLIFFNSVSMKYVFQGRKIEHILFNSLLALNI